MERHLGVVGAGLDAQVAPRACRVEVIAGEGGQVDQRRRPPAAAGRTGRRTAMGRTRRSGSDAGRAQAEGLAGVGRWRERPGGTVAPGAGGQPRRRHGPRASSAARPPRSGTVTSKAAKTIRPARAWRSRPGGHRGRASVAGPAGPSRWRPRRRWPPGPAAAAISAGRGQRRSRPGAAGGSWPLGHEERPGGPVGSERGGQPGQRGRRGVEPLGEGQPGSGGRQRGVDELVAVAERVDGGRRGRRTARPPWSTSGRPGRPRARRLERTSGRRQAGGDVDGVRRCE